MENLICDKKEEGRDYRYFAFISYSSKDKKWAKWLQKKLETYRLPSKIRKEHSGLPKKIAPIFRDDTDLSGVVLEDALHRELAESKYLIVVCSPNSAASEWVGKEIGYFRSLGGDSRIIPFIIGDNPEECMHEKIKEITPALLGIDVNALGREKAFIRLVATMLNLRYDELLMRNGKRKNYMRTSLGALSALLLIGVSVLWYYTSEQSTYYSDYILRYEIPKGIGKLSKSEQSKRIESYRIVKKGGNVIRLETVNSEGELTVTNHYTEATEFPLQEYSYDDGVLKSISVKNEYGDEKMVKVLSYGENSIAIDFLREKNGISISTKITALGQYFTGDEKSAITRQINDYDDNGFKIRERYYRDNLGTLEMDDLGIYGKEFTYTENGQIASTVFIDDTGKKSNCKHGYAEVKYEYNGTLLGKIEYFDEEGAPAKDVKGVSVYASEFDNYGNMVTIKHLNEEGKLYASKENVAMKVQEIKDGKVISVKNYDADENPGIDITGVHEIKAKYDKKGRNYESSVYDTEGNPTKLKDNNLHKICREYDKNGRITLEKYYDLNDNPCCDKETGAYAIRVEYNKNGDVTEFEYLGEDGKLCRSKMGYAKEVDVYDDKKDMLTEVRYYDENEKLCRSSKNYAVAKVGYDIYGNVNEVRYFDENEKPCYSSSGIAVIKWEYENGQPTSEKYFNVDDEALLQNGVYHEIRYTYDDEGRMKSESYHKIDGSLTIESAENNYAAVLYDYDRYGNITERRYYDVGLNPSLNYMYSKVKTIYNDRGKIVEEYYENEGYTELNYYSYFAKYDEMDNLLQEFYFGKDLSDAKFIKARGYEYDSRNRVISKTTIYTGDIMEIEKYEYDAFDNNVKVTFVEYDAISKTGGKRITLYEYDEYGNNIASIFTNTDGKLVLGEEGFAILKREYSPEGYIISEETYGTDGNPIISIGGYFRSECEYDYAGNRTEIKYYGIDKKPFRAEDGGSYRVVQEYDAMGRIIVKKWFDENDKPYTGASGYHAVSYSYSPMGELESEIYYDANDNVLSCMKYCVTIGEPYEGIALKDGIKEGDILLKYGDWEYDSGKDLAVVYADIKDEASKKFGMEKEISVYSVEQKRIISRKYDNLAGFRIVERKVDAEILNEALKLYGKS